MLRQLRDVLPGGTVIRDGIQADGSHIREHIRAAVLAKAQEALRGAGDFRHRQHIGVLAAGGKGNVLCDVDVVVRLAPALRVGAKG